MKARLPRFFSFSTTSDLVRFGRDGDGGYLVSEKDVERANCLLSFGVNDDWSFEQSFLKARDINIVAYDGSISAKYFLKNLIQSVTRIDNPKVFIHWLKTLIGYKVFFSKPTVKHIEKFVGLSCPPHYVPLRQVIEDTKAHDIFVKMDIEGSEYRCMDDLIAKQEKICALVLELHDCDIRMREIRHFIEKFELPLIHVHANNYCPIRSTDLCPTVLELTFSRYGNIDVPSNLPHVLDMPNNVQESEIKIEIENEEL